MAVSGRFEKKKVGEIRRDSIGLVCLKPRNHVLKLLKVFRLRLKLCYIIPISSCMPHRSGLKKRLYLCFIYFPELAVVPGPDKTNRGDNIIWLPIAIGALVGIILVAFIVRLKWRRR